MWDLSSLTRDRTDAPCIEARSLNHWTAREVLCSVLMHIIFGYTELVYLINCYEVTLPLMI